MRRIDKKTGKRREGMRGRRGEKAKRLVKKGAEAGRKAPKEAEKTQKAGKGEIKSAGKI